MIDDLMPTSPEMDKADNWLSEPTDGDRRIQAIEGDSLTTLARYTRSEFGVEEGNAILQASLDRMPREGGFEREYYESLRIVIRERHPLWAAQHANLYDDVPPMVEQPR